MYAEFDFKGRILFGDMRTKLIRILLGNSLPGYGVDPSGSGHRSLAGFC
jgi:hypothetical protein